MKGRQFDRFVLYSTYSWRIFMPRQEKIKFTITQDGMVKEEIQGVYGDACERLTKRVEDALGHVHFTQETADRYVTNEQKEVQRVTF